MVTMMIIIGLLFYALSLALPGGQWYLSLTGGVLTGFGVTRAIRSFWKQDQSFEVWRHKSDSDVEAATTRILQASEGRPWRVIKLNS